jgi:hypothetical protein
VHLGFVLRRLYLASVLCRPYFVYGDEALSDESLFKSNSDEALNDDPLKKSNGDEALNAE